MNPQEFFKALENLDDAFFIWNNEIRTRARRSGDISVDPIVAVARFQGYKGVDITEAVCYLNLQMDFAVKIAEISDGKGVYSPVDLKLKAKLINRTIAKKT